MGECMRLWRRLREWWLRRPHLGLVVLLLIIVLVVQIIWLLVELSHRAGRP